MLIINPNLHLNKKRFLNEFSVINTLEGFNKDDQPRIILHEDTVLIKSGIVNIENIKKALK